MSEAVFVVQKHRASRIHWDFRLEIDGVLKSWAVPKEPPLEPGVKRLVVQVEDHQLGYARFEGTIPKGQYGAGTVKIWDNGKFELESLNRSKIVFVLHGGKMKGRHALVKFGEGENWLLFKMEN